MTELFILVKLFRLTEYFLYIMSCSLWHGIPVLQHNHGQSITTTSRHRRHMTQDTLFDLIGARGANVNLFSTTSAKRSSSGQ